MKHRFFIDAFLTSGALIDIAGPESRHIREVLRLKAGDLCILFNGNGSEYAAEISFVGRDKVSVRVAEAIKAETESPLDITLGQGIPKSDRMDLIVQKGTELGVSRIVPLYTERVVKSNISASRIERWRRIAVESSKQSGRVKVPIVQEPVSLAEFATESATDALKLMPWEDEQGVSLKSIAERYPTAEKIILLIGPEGGFPDTEVGLARSSGFIPVSLGRRILRTETAAISMLSIVQYVYGDIQ